MVSSLTMLMSWADDHIFWFKSVLIVLRIYFLSVSVEYWQFSVLHTDDYLTLLFEYDFCIVCGRTFTDIVANQITTIVTTQLIVTINNLLFVAVGTNGLISWGVEVRSFPFCDINGASTCSSYTTSRASISGSWLIQKLYRVNKS